tara:strand:- start:9 stop:446 length:438 start_codon:yes stop_codon:yes gene_type:complete
MKRGKEFTLDVSTNYKVKLGTVDNKNPKSIYINLSAWGELIKEEEDLNYESVISKLRNKIKHHINSNINKEDFHKGRYIIDLDMRSSGINKTKRSFMSCEITLFQKNSLPVNKPYIIESATDIVNNVIIECLDKQNHFTFYKTKN